MANSTCGVKALFGGPSGTGKTLAARVLASELKLDLYRLDLSAVVNKYIGETEKNLNQVFSRAEELHVILLLDEGDSLLTNRTAVQSSNDRYANLETNFLLQRIESFEGILFVTTNALQRIDGAFQRRMDVLVEFRLPEADERRQLWSLHLPPNHEVSDSWVHEVARRCTLSGGQIRNASLHASLLALARGSAVSTPDAETARAARVPENGRGLSAAPPRLREIGFMPGLISRRRPLPKPSPESDPRFKKVMEDLKRGAARTKHHAPAARKAAEASAAAKGPPNEKLAAGKSAQVDKIQGAPTKNPEPTSFLAVLQAEIAKAMPKTLSDTEKFMKGGSSEELKGSLKGNVSKQKDEAAGGVKGASKEAPKEAGTATRRSPSPASPPLANPAVNGAEAMPVPKSDADVSLQDSKQDTEQQMKACGRHRDATARRPNDPRFSAVLTSKDQVAKQADAGPAQYRARKKECCRQRPHRPKEWRARARTPWSACEAVPTRRCSPPGRRKSEGRSQAQGSYRPHRADLQQHQGQRRSQAEQSGDRCRSPVRCGTDAALKAMTDYVESRVSDLQGRPLLRARRRRPVDPRPVQGPAGRSRTPSTSRAARCSPG